MTALAASGLNAADASTSLADPSAQDFYLGDWQASGPGGAATDAERAILSGVASGIQASRLSTDADTTMPCTTPEPAGAAALDRRVPTHAAEAQRGLDLERIARRPRRHRHDRLRVAAFCAAGVGPGDNDLDEAIALLHTLQDPATGGFIAPPEAFGIGVNTDTTAWVMSGLIQCGIDPQSAAWTTAQARPRSTRPRSMLGRWRSPAGAQPHAGRLPPSAPPRPRTVASP
jgi:hypothetical protein